MCAYLHSALEQHHTAHRAHLLSNPSPCWWCFTQLVQSTPSPLRLDVRPLICSSLLPCTLPVPSARSLTSTMCWPCTAPPLTTPSRSGGSSSSSRSRPHPALQRWQHCLQPCSLRATAAPLQRQMQQQQPTAHSSPPATATTQQQQQQRQRQRQQQRLLRPVPPVPQRWQRLQLCWMLLLMQWL